MSEILEQHKQSQKDGNENLKQIGIKDSLMDLQVTLKTDWRPSVGSTLNNQKH